MKIMTINTHSYIEENSEEKLEIFVDAISRLKPDIIAMQEVNQKTSSEIYEDKEFVLNQFGIELKADNYGLRAVKALAKKGVFYQLVWLGIKNAYEVYDEGICFLCRNLVKSSCAFLISKSANKSNWRKRMALGIEVNGEWFYNVHLGRWDDSEDPFYNQWLCLSEKATHGTPRWLMGDFNAPSDYENEGYGSILDSGWYDTYMLAEEKDGGSTVSGGIDGWKDKTNFENKRIDYIFTDTKREIRSSHTVFNGKNEKKVSDHNAVLISYEGNDFHA